MNVAECATNLDAIVAALIGGATIGALAVAMLRASRPVQTRTVYVPLEPPFEPWTHFAMSRREWYDLPRRMRSELIAVREVSLHEQRQRPTGVLTWCGVGHD